MSTCKINKTKNYIASHKAFHKKLIEIFNQNVKPGRGQMYQIAKILKGKGFKPNKNQRQCVCNWVKGYTTPRLSTLHRIIEVFNVNQSDKELLLKLREKKTLGSRRSPLNIVRTTKKSHAILLEVLKESIAGLESGHLDVDETLLKLKSVSNKLVEENIMI
tara:strand:- start:2604 stop:3086 length:483 start_codon:yes stop_codon:yes gene_type:complete